MRMDAGLSTLEKECAEQGDDYEEVLDQLAVERAMKLARGMPLDAAAPASASASTAAAQPAVQPDEPPDEQADDATPAPAPAQGDA